MGYAHSTIDTSDDTDLFIHQWEVPDPKDILLIVHGYAEHGFRYDHFASHLNDAGYSVFAYDLRGHGRSGGIRAFVERFDEHLSDLEQVLTHIGHNVHLYAHSMGGLISARYCAIKEDARIKSLITSGAALSLGQPIPAIKKMVAPVLNKLAPRLPIEKMDKTYICRDPEVMEQYMSDPLVYTGLVRVRTGLEMIKTIELMQTNLHRITVPLLAMHGTADQLITPDGTQKMYNDAESKDKELLLLDGWYHELVNEPEKEVIYNKVVDWLDRHK